MGIFSFLKKSNNKAVFCGLDNSGKSTIISFLQTGTFIKHTPTMGKKLKEIEVQGTRIAIFDMGGQSDFREMWLGEIKNAKCVVFVIDTHDVDRYNEAKEELNKILPAIMKNKINLLIMANKIDLNKDSTMAKIIRKFNLTEIDNFEIMEISAKTGFGMTDAFVKLYSLLTGENIEKSVFAKAISIYTNEGKKILFQKHLIEDDEINQMFLEGAYLAAIKKSSQMSVF
ncbi:ADP-ribosylation factor-like protein [Candidatus Harpocratesius sp.]